jgi:hypothetical protein
VGGRGRQKREHCSGVRWQLVVPQAKEGGGGGLAR